MESGSDRIISSAEGNLLDLQRSNSVSSRRSLGASHQIHTAHHVRIDQGASSQQWWSRYSSHWSRVDPQWTSSDQNLNWPQGFDMFNPEPPASPEGRAITASWNILRPRQLRSTSLVPGPVPQWPVLEEVDKGVLDTITGTTKVVVSYQKCPCWWHCPSSGPEYPKRHWLLGKVEETFPDRNGLVRNALVKTKSSTFLRPISKLVMVLEFDEWWDSFVYYCFVLYYVCSAFFASCQARLCFVCDCSERSVRGRYVNAHSRFCDIR